MVGPTFVNTIIQLSDVWDGSRSPGVGFARKLTLVPYTRTQRLALAIVPPLAALFIRLLGATLRYQNVTAPNTPIGDTIPGPTVFAFWHRSLLACAYRFRNRDIAILISRSFDGELIARTVELLGFRAIRGSSSRGGASGLRGMAEAYAAGHRCAITADGPRGPAQIAKPGTLQLAQLTGAPWVGAFYAFPLRAWTLNSWDKFLIPKPFSRVLVTFPPHVPTEQSAIQQALDQSVQMAESTAPPLP
jgi:lysophospholipid acyltransferase (LPLAT)-like uncharacterized protein